MIKTCEVFEMMAHTTTQYLCPLFTQNSEWLHYPATFPHFTSGWISFESEKYSQIFQIIEWKDYDIGCLLLIVNYQ